MIKISILSLKGGVGKTNTTYNLGASLACEGRRVLVVDLDRQRNLTQGFFGASASRAIDRSETAAAILAGDGATADALIKPTGIARLDIVAGSIEVGDFNLPRPAEAPWDSQACLREFFDEVGPDRYDFALIDSPPDPGLCAWVSGVAADYMLVPLIPEGWSVQGLPDVQDFLKSLKAGPNPGVDLLGIVLNRVARKAIHQAYEDVLKAQYGDAILDSKIPDATGFLDSVAALKPVAIHKPKGEPAKAFARLAAEVIARVDSRRSSTPRLAEVA